MKIKMLIPVLVLLALNSTSNTFAQTKDVKATPVEELTTLLNHDDLKVSLAAYRVLQQLTDSKDDSLKTEASLALKEFKDEATDWLKKNATEFVEIWDASVPEPIDIRDRTRHRCMAAKFIKSKIDCSKLRYLVPFKIGRLTMVKVDSLRDEHLVVLSELPHIWSLTMEDTRITGQGLAKVSIPNLHHLYLSGSKISTKGLSEIDRKKFPKLMQVGLRDTELKESVIKEFKEKLKVR